MPPTSSSTNSPNFLDITPQHRNTFDPPAIQSTRLRFLWTMRTSRREIGHLTTCIAPTSAPKSEFGMTPGHHPNPIHPVLRALFHPLEKCQVKKKKTWEISWVLLFLPRDLLLFQFGLERLGVAECMQESRQKCGDFNYMHLESQKVLQDH